MGGPLVFTSGGSAPTTALRDAAAITLRERQIQIVNLDGDAWKPAFPDQPALGATWVFDPATSTLTGTQVGFEGDPPDPSLIVSVMPSDLPHGSTGITATIGGVTLPLRDAVGEPITASQLTPSRLHVMCRTSTAFQIMEPLGKRPQDFLVRYAASANRTLTEAEVAAGTTSSTGQITVESDFPDRGFHFFGVPDAVPDLGYIGEPGSGVFGGVNLLEDQFERVSGTVNDPNGVAYKWWRRSYMQDFSSYPRPWNVHVLPVVAV